MLVTGSVDGFIEVLLSGQSLQYSTVSKVTALPALCQCGVTNLHLQCAGVGPADSQAEAGSDLPGEGALHDARHRSVGGCILP